MRATNVKLSAAEMALACNSEVLLTKNRVIEKVYALFGELAETFSQTLPQYRLPPEIAAASPKISRGENYLGLPWVVLDYPRHFKGDDFFSVRSFFWWGNYFSMAILVKGKWLKLMPPENILATPVGKEWLISTVNDPWEHHISPGNTRPLDGLKDSAIQALVEKNGFLKLQVKTGIENWNEVQGFMELAFADFMALSLQL